MPGFDALYKQTVTLFNRRVEGDQIFWYPVVIPNVHLVISKSIIVSTYGDQATDNAMLHIRYIKSGDEAIIPTNVGNLVYKTPKEFRREGIEGLDITFAYGDDFDFIMAGDYGERGSIADDDYPKGFFNHMNKEYDEVFAITGVSKYNLLPHFEITAR